MTMNAGKEYNIEGQRVAICIAWVWMQVDTRFGTDQALKLATIRPMTGPKELFTGVAVCSPSDMLDGDIGDRVALSRAVYEFLNSTRFEGRFYTRRQASRVARTLLWSEKEGANLASIQLTALPMSA